MVFLNLFWALFLIYYGLLVNDIFSKGISVTNQTRTENLLATIGDLFFILHDWLFAIQFLDASLRMPIAINIFTRETD